MGNRECEISRDQASYFPGITDHCQNSSVHNLSERVCLRMKLFEVEVVHLNAQD